MIRKEKKFKKKRKMRSIVKIFKNYMCSHSRPTNYYFVNIYIPIY